MRSIDSNDRNYKNNDQNINGIYTKFYDFSSIRYTDYEEYAVNVN